MLWGRAARLALASTALALGFAGASASPASAAFCVEKFAAPGSAFFGDSKILLKSTEGFEVRFECGGAEEGFFVGFRLRTSRSIVPREVTHSGFSHLGNCRSEGMDLYCRAGGSQLDVKAVLKTAGAPCKGSPVKLSIQPELIRGEGETYFSAVESLPSPCSHGSISLKGVPSKCVSDDFSVRVRVPGALQGIADNRGDAVLLKLDGKVIGRQGGTLGEEGDLTLKVRVPAEKLKGGKHELKVDSEPRATRTATFRRC